MEKGKFVRNNVDYSGGVANQKELSYADYLALSESERKNGTTYYVKDLNQGVQGTNIYYNQEEDVIYLLLPDGTYTPFASGGIKIFNINDITKLSPEDWVITNDDSGLQTEIVSNPFSFNINGKTTDGNSNIRATAVSKSLSLGSFNRLTIIGKIKGYFNYNSSYPEKSFSIELVNDTTGEADYLYRYKRSNPSGGIDISESVTVELDPTTTYKIRLTIVGYTGWYPSYMKFDSFLLYKDVN